MVRTDPTPRTRARRTPPLILAICLALHSALVVLSGCAGGSNAAKDAPQASYVERYARGDYSGAKSLAQTQAQNSSGIERDRAQLIAGLSARELGQTAEAVSILTPLLAHSDNEIAGRAGAAMGLIAKQQKDNPRAATLLSDAARKLGGDESAKAAMAAGEAYMVIGRKDAAMAQYNAGLAAAQSPALKTSLREHLEGKKYTVQAGAFSTKANADKRVGEVRGKAQSLGIGEPRIVTGTAKGKPTYVVQIGEFVSRQDARSASLKLGNGTLVTEID